MNLLTLQSQFTVLSCVCLKADFAVVRPSDNNWYVFNGADQTWVSRQFGKTGDVFVPADYDGDGRTDIAVFRPTENVWYLMKSSLNQFSAVKFGAKGDIPTPADYDGDGKTDIALKAAFVQRKAC
ncbi:MAG TPA: VCBS repeat-containing protein [Pyrinomonadaceae bacterium]|nr:VCBS repeat-containing protein [Pyrinomonadaceae bacterium]